jgi:glycosyltransferase involved in cell wall biosynthesis
MTGPTLPASTGPLVSVVTPFYNCAAFLDEAIRSVLAQDHSNFEYILADNCSSDGSLEIAQRYAARDSRIRLITHSEFIGQDPNYSRALGYISAASIYCKIVQGDDWIYPRCLSEMVSLAAAHPSVAIVGCCFLAGDQLAGHGLPFDRHMFSGREACRTRLLSGGTFFGSPTCLLYRSDIVRHRSPFFAADETNADTIACFEILGSTDFALVPQILAYLRRGNSSTWENLQRLGTANFLNYALVERFGPQYLSPDERIERGRTLENIHLRSLARKAIRRPGREFWEFHAVLYASLGRPLPRARIGWYIVDLFLDKLFNLRKTLESTMALLRRRLSRREPR